MMKDDARLRVRQVGNEMEECRSHIEFSYKRRLPSNGNTKEEEEIEVDFDVELGDFLNILCKMGYIMTTSYERYRTTYKYKNTKVTLDEFPFGYILEIEGENENIAKACRGLNLNMAESTAESCDDVYDRICRDKGIEPKNHILFSDNEMPAIRI